MLKGAYELLVKLVRADGTAFNFADTIEAGLLVKAIPFAVSVQLVRPANTTQYTIGDLINSGPTVNCALTAESADITPTSMTGIYVGQAVTGASIAANSVVASVGATTVTLDKPANADQAAEAVTFTSATVLPCLDFSALGGTAGRFIEIHSAIISSSNGGASTKLEAALALYKATAMQANQADGTAFAPAYATAMTNRAGMIEDVKAVVAQGVSLYEISKADVNRLCRLGTGGKLYAAILAANAYTPASGEVLTLSVNGVFH